MLVVSEASGASVGGESVPVVAAARRPHSDTTLFQEARTPELKNLSNRGAGNSGQGLAEDPPLQQL